MASSLQAEVNSSTTSFEEQFKELTSLISFFERCSEDTQVFIDNMRQTLSDSITTDLITATERQRLQSFMAKKATLLVVGQTNSGKSSFVNELLGGSFMPTSEVPCTSRIVRLKYSEENYYQVVHGHEKDSKTFFSKKKLPKEAIELGESQRNDPSWVNAVVEVGLNNPLLQSGHLEVIDAPGMSENETLDEMVNECIRGVLQVIVYVIDGNSSLRLQERGFLLNLKKKVGNLPIFYACNKIDKDQKAQEFDRDSESEDDEETKPRSTEEKVKLAYQALAKCRMVPGDISSEDCPFFHSLSTREVRSARLKKETNRFTEQFEVLKSKLLKFAAVGINTHLKSGTELLCRIQERVFGLFLAHDFKKGGQTPVQEDLFVHLEQKELKYVHRMRSYITDNRSKIISGISKAIRAHRTKIETEAAEMQFESIRIGNVVGRNEIVEQCRRQIKDIVLFKVMDISLAKVQSTINLITCNVRSSLEEAFTEVAKQDDHLANIVKRQLEYSFLQQFQQRNECRHFDYALMKFGVRMMEEARKVVSDVWSAVTGKGTFLNDEWKRGVARDVLDSIDCYAIADRICANIATDLDTGHQLFLANLGYMKIFCAAAAEQSETQQRFSAENAPSFAGLMSKAAALDQTLGLEVPSRAVLGLPLLGRQGHRGRVFVVQTSKVSTSNLVAKQLSCDDTLEKEHWLGITRALRRVPGDLTTILKPISLVLDKSNRITVLFPRMSIDLYDRLEKCAHLPIQMLDGLRIVQQMCDALENCWDRGLYHVDLRITNVLLDDNNKAKLNVSKPRNDTIPYPDEQAPFHVPDRSPGERKMDTATADTLKIHSTYSLAVLLWLVIEQKYIRPEYAETKNVNDVYDSIAQRKDSSFIKQRIDPGGVQWGGRHLALTTVLSTFDAQKVEGQLLTWLDEFKLQVTGALSSYETMETEL